MKQVFAASAAPPHTGLLRAFGRLPRLLTWALLLILPAALLLPGAAGFPYPRPDAQFTDMAIAHYPYSLFLQRSLGTGSVPLWSPLILSGAPLAANPLSGFWYPPGWVALLLPLPLGFNLAILLHLVWGGFGLFRLLREEGLRLPAALLGGAAFALLPKLYAHYGAGHVTLLYAVPWTPWLLLAARRSSGKLFSAWEAVILALIFTADPRWSFYAAAAWLGCRLACAPAGEGWAGAGKRLLGGLAAALLAGLLTAPLLLPLVEYARLSTRQAMAAGDQLLYSLPASRLLGLLYPDFSGFHEYMLYTGQALLILALLALLGVAGLRGVRFWRWLGALSLAWSLGSALPFAELLFSLPGLELLRVPSRALFLTGPALCALGAYAVDALLSNDAPTGLPRLRPARLVLSGLAAFSLALTLGVAVVSGQLPLNFAWGSGFLLAAVVWVLLRMAGRLRLQTWLVGMALLVCVDLLFMDRSLFFSRPADRVLSEGRQAAEYLAGQVAAAPMRVYSPSYSLPQQTAADLGLHLADGVDPLQLESYAAFMEPATGVPRTGYSVTLPEFPNGDPGVDNAAYRPDPAALGRLNVAYIASEFPLDVPGLLLEKQFGATYIYRNRNARPRAWLQNGPAADGEWRPVQILSLQPDRIEIQAEGAGLLVLSEVAYPGWQAQVDGRAADLVEVSGLLRGVQLPQGVQRVVFVFRPLSVYLGLTLFAAGVCLLAAALIRRRLSKAAPAGSKP